MLWQFKMGGGHHLSFSHQLTVSNGLSLTTLNSREITLCSGSFKWGGGHHLSFSCQLPVSNGFSWTVWIHAELTHFHWQFCAGGRTSAKVGSSAKFELISSFALASQSSFVSYKKRKTNNPDVTNRTVGCVVKTA